MQKGKQDEKFELSAEDRKVLGKQVKKLRRDGVIPANVYGSDFKSRSVSIIHKDFSQTYKKAKETGIVHLKVGKDELPVMVKNVQRHPVEGTILHVDFRKIDLTKKIETEVPVVVVGESEAVAQKAGVLLTQSDHLLIEALPADIPQNIEVDISKITEIGQDIKVSDISKAGNFVIKEEPEKVIVSVIAHKEESLEPETAAEAPEVITAKEGEEGVEPAAEGGAPKEEKKEEAPEETKE